jgi:hypothetical protein
MHACGTCPFNVHTHNIPCVTHILGQVLCKILSPNPTPMLHNLYLTSKTNQKVAIQSSSCSVSNFSWNIVYFNCEWFELVLVSSWISIGLYSNYRLGFIVCQTKVLRFLGTTIKT